MAQSSDRLKMELVASILIGTSLALWEKRPEVTMCAIQEPLHADCMDHAQITDMILTFCSEILPLIHA